MDFGESGGSGYNGDEEALSSDLDGFGSQPILVLFHPPTSGKSPLQCHVGGTYAVLIKHFNNKLSF